VPATVLDVINGDTILLELDLGWHIKFVSKVRIARIDAPELATPQGIEAKAYAQTLLKPGDDVTFLSRALDKYGRPIGHIIFDGAAFRDFGDEMVLHDHAVTVDW
jgi:endonuclease YncB( thermonuclease family)